MFNSLVCCSATFYAYWGISHLDSMADEVPNTPVLSLAEFLATVEWPERAADLITSALKVLNDNGVKVGPANAQHLQRDTILPSRWCSKWHT